MSLIAAIARWFAESYEPFGRWLARQPHDINWAAMPKRGPEPRSLVWRGRLGGRYCRIVDAEARRVCSS